MTKTHLHKIFRILTKGILTWLTGTSFWMLGHTIRMNECITPAFYHTVPEQVTHVLAGLMLYVLFACAISYAEKTYDT